MFNKSYALKVRSLAHMADLESEFRKILKGDHPGRAEQLVGIIMEDADDFEKMGDMLYTMALREQAYKAKDFLTKYRMSFEYNYNFG